MTTTSNLWPRLGRIAALGAMLTLTACSPKPAAAVPQSPFQLTATIQDIMHHEVDPSADFLWDAVGTTVTSKGEEHQMPHTDEEWNELRHRAITLVEATNLLVMEGRKVVADGKEVEDAHVTGIRNAQEIQAAINADRATWIGFAQALHGAGAQALAAIDARDADKLLHAGEALDAVCEACHLKYWYPGQVIPPLPDVIPKTQ
ncbi:MAG: hypothetical protein QM808_16555 [Steroidobacteraceae bacterium]